MTVSRIVPVPAGPAVTSTWIGTPLKMVPLARLTLATPPKNAVPACGSALPAVTLASTAISGSPRMSEAPAIRHSKCPVATPPSAITTPIPNRDPSMSPSPSRSRAKVPAPPPVTCTTLWPSAWVAGRTRIATNATSTSNRFIADPPPSQRAGPTVGRAGTPWFTSAWMVLADPDPDVLAPIGVVEVDDTRDVKRHPLLGGVIVAGRGLGADDAEHRHDAVGLPGRGVQHHPHLHRPAAQVIVAKVDTDRRDEAAAVE